MTTRATVYAVVAVALSATMVPWACAGEEETRQRDEIPPEAERTGAPGVEEDAGVSDRQGGPADRRASEELTPEDATDDGESMYADVRDYEPDADDGGGGGGYGDVRDYEPDAGEVGGDAPDGPDPSIEEREEPDEPEFDDEPPGGGAGDGAEQRRGGPGDEREGGRAEDLPDGSDHPDHRDPNPGGDVGGWGSEPEGRRDTGMLIEEKSVDTGVSEDAGLEFEEPEQFDRDVGLDLREEHGTTTPEARERQRVGRGSGAE